MAICVKASAQSLCVSTRKAAALPPGRRNNLISLVQRQAQISPIYIKYICVFGRTDTFTFDKYIFGSTAGPLWRTLVLFRFLVNTVYFIMFWGYFQRIKPWQKLLFSMGFIEGLEMCIVKAFECVFEVIFTFTVTKLYFKQILVIYFIRKNMKYCSPFKNSSSGIFEHMCKGIPQIPPSVCDQWMYTRSSDKLWAADYNPQAGLTCPNLICFASFPSSQLPTPIAHLQGAIKIRQAATLITDSLHTPGRYINNQLNWN